MHGDREVYKEGQWCIGTGSTRVDEGEWEQGGRQQGMRVHGNREVSEKA